MEDSKDSPERLDYDLQIRAIENRLGKERTTILNKMYPEDAGLDLKFAVAESYLDTVTRMKKEDNPVAATLRQQVEQQIASFKKPDLLRLPSSLLNKTNDEIVKHRQMTLEQVRRNTSVNESTA